VTIAILVGIAALLGAGCAALGWSYALRVLGATSGDVGAQVIALKKLPEEERLGALASRSRPGTWEHQLAEDALAAPDDAARIAVVNEALTDLEHVFQAGAGWPSASIRIALFGAMLLGVAAFLVSRELRWTLTILGIGGVAALACVEANRAARRSAEAQRRAIDGLISTTLRALDRIALPVYDRREPFRRRRH
jgi:hypothetical protein